MPSCFCPDTLHHPLIHHLQFDNSRLFHLFVVKKLQILSTSVRYLLVVWMLRNCSFFISFSLIRLPKISTGKPKGRRPNAVLFLDCQMVLAVSQRKEHNYEQWCPPSKVILSDTASLHMTLRAFVVIIAPWDRHHGPLTIKCKSKSKICYLVKSAYPSPPPFFHSSSFSLSLCLILSLFEVLKLCYKFDLIILIFWDELGRYQIEAGFPDHQVICVDYASV